MALSRDEELFLVTCIIKFSAQAMCLNKHDLQQIVDHLTVGPRVNHNKVRLKLGKNWRRGFLRRHASAIGYSACIPLATQHVVTQDLVDELRNNYNEFNKLIDDQRIQNSGIVSVDEVGITALKEDSVHGKVFHARNARPTRTVRIIQAHSTLLAAIKADGTALSPVLVHPHVKLQPKQTAAFDAAAARGAHGPDPPALHLASGKPGGAPPTGNFNDYLFDKGMREHVLPQLPTDAPSVVLMDGAAGHWNPRLLLHGRRDLRQEGPPTFFFTYPPNLSRFVAPPDDHAVFGAFQRTRRQLLFEQGGPEDREQLMDTAGRAYAKHFRPEQVRSAFLRRGYVAPAVDRRRAQASVIEQLQEQVDSRAWAHRLVDEGRLPASLLRLESLKDRRRSGRARKPLGDAVSPLGVINSDENIASLRALLDERVSGQEGGSRGKNRRKYSE